MFYNLKNSMRFSKLVYIATNTTCLAFITYWAVFETMFLRWNCWEKIESKKAKWRILALFETIFRKLELLRKFWKQREKMGHSDALWNSVLEVETAEKKLKARKLNDAFWHYLKRFLGSWNSWENFESKEGRWCIRTLFEECGRQLSGELLNVEICSSLK